MERILEYSRKIPIGAIGRNGYMNIQGLNLFKAGSDPDVVITPINSKGLASSYYSIPVEDIPAFIEVLKQFVP